MKRLRLFILIFSVAVSIPLAFVIWQTYAGLEQEERAQLRFFSETLFDQMEKELADLVQQEENRAVDEYRYLLAQVEEKEDNKQQLSPLAHPASPEYILGYLQNNPDGSFQTPLIADMGSVPQDKRALVSQLKEVNRIFNHKKFSISQPAPTPAPTSIKPAEEKKKKESFSERYLTRTKNAPSKTYLGKKQQRVEEITAEQAYNIASEEEGGRQYNDEVQKVRAPASVVGRSSWDREVEEKSEQNRSRDSAAALKERVLEQGMQQSVLIQDEPDSNQERFQVEVAPFQSVSIKDDHVYIFRRIAINNQIYRQGFILLVEPMLRHLIAAHFEKQPLARFTALQMQRRDQGQKREIVQAGIAITTSNFLAERVFPPPFDFMSVTLRAKTLPSSPARRSLNAALVVLGVFMSLGLLAIYQSARTIVMMSERRSQFVSSVTHELKTPLTNIRMYIEMLEQGIAATPEREQEYLSILGSESTRLSGLINNVLDLAKLEKKQRHFHMQEGQLDDVLTEVETIMGQKLKQDGFTLAITAAEVPKFSYDRDVLIQILMNLIENSVKFGKQAGTRQITISVDSLDNRIRIAVSDTGPGIPRHALKKVFDDFYRVDNDLTRATGGTGIGLALVKKFITAMGGSVQAANNREGGCTITLLLPITKASSG
jgi:signal transduction histidine kinase